MTKRHDYKETNIIYCGDSKDILGKMPENSVDLIYLDPPFFSHKHYEGFWGDEKNVHIKTQFSDEKWERLKKSIKPNILKIYEHIEERWKGGRQGIYVYIAYMRERLEQCWRVLKPTGSIYIHCDWHAGHYLKIMMDEIFGYNHFVNEIVWRYRRWPSKQKAFQRMHDTIFWYRKTDKKENFIWNQQYEELSESSKRQWKGKLRVDKTTEKGTRYSETSEKKSPGVPMSDVWIISQITAPFKEYRGYPTQKPEALVERIIKASSNEGDIVLDPFCGGGTTLAVAKRLKRKFIGIDISRTACRLARERLGKGVKIFGDETLEEVKKMNPHDVAELIIVDRWDGIISPKKSRDFGIDGWVENRTIPVQVKRWEHKVGRPEVDKFKTAVERDNKKKGIIVADGFSKDSYAEVARIKAKHGIDIELVEFKTIFETHNKSHNHNHGKIYIDHPLMMIF